MRYLQGAEKYPILYNVCFSQRSERSERCYSTNVYFHRYLLRVYRGIWRYLQVYEYHVKLFVVVTALLKFLFPSV